MKKRFLAVILILFAAMLFAAAAGAASVSVSGYTLSAEYSCQYGHKANYTKFEDGTTTIDKSKWNTENVIRVTTKVSYGCRNDDCKIDKSDTVTLEFPVASGDCHKKYEKNVSRDSISFTLNSQGKPLMGMTVFNPKAASCTSDGVKTQHAQCGGCGKYFTLDGSTGLPDKEITDRSPYIIQAPGHTFKHHEAFAATCTKSGNIEYWECTTCKRCYGDADGNNLLNYNTDIFTAINPKNHTGNISYVMGSMPELHRGTYTCCGRSVDAEKHTYNSSGVCEKCSYSAPFRVRKGTSEWYCSSYNEAVGALANGADTVTFIKDYPETFAIDENCTLEIESGVIVGGITVRGKSVRIQNKGTVNGLSKTGGSLVLKPGNGVYKKITTTSGSVGDFLEGSYAYINTADKKIYHREDAVCGGTEISGVIVKNPPIQYVDIKGAAKTGANAYSLTVKEGETVTLEANTYQLSFAVQAEKVTTKWDCGSIPADKYTETPNGWRSTLTLKDLTPGTYTLSCSATESGYNYTVSATLTLTVEENGEIGGKCTHEKDADGYCTVENCDHDESCCKKRDSRTEIFILEKGVSHSRTYNGTDDASFISLSFTDADGKNVDVPTDCYTLTAKFNSPNVADASYITGKVTLTEKGAALYRLAKDTFTHAGSLNKADAFPTLRVSKVNLEFTTTDNILDYISIENVKENAAVTYYYTVNVDSMYDTSLWALNTEIKAGTSFPENDVPNNRKFYLFARTAETANYKESVTNSFEVKVKIMPVITTVPGIEKTLYAGDSFGSAFLNKDLKGGVVKAAGEVIEGTFAFDETELARGKPLEAGEHSLKVIFTPDFKYGGRYASAECRVPLNLPKRQFVSVSAWYLEQYVYGTPYSEISMPDSVSIYALGDVNNAGTGLDFGRQMSIEWDFSTYDPHTVAEQTIYGTFDRSYFEKFIEFPEGEEVKAITKITLQPDPSDTVITEKPVFRWSNGEFILEDNHFLIPNTFVLGTHGTKKCELIGGKATSGGKAVKGTWGFAKGTSQFFNDPGKYEITVVFTPKDTSLYKPSECKIEITVTKSTLDRIAQPWYDITHQYVGTEFGDLNLPSAVTVYTTDGTSFSGIGVNWNESTYDKNSTQWQTVIGKLKLDNAPIIQPESGEIKAEMKVKLKGEGDKITPVITAPPVFRWKNSNVTLADNTMFVHKNFKGDQATPLAELVGGTARDGNTVVTGSFRFKDETPNYFSAIGAQTTAVIFTPSDSSTYSQVEFDITVNVIRQKLMSVTDKVVITDKEMGMPFDKLGLPELIRQFITTADVAFNVIRVKWDPSSYNPYTTEKQTVYGKVIIDEDIVENPDNIRAVAEITLKPKTVESGDYVIELPYIPAAYIGQSLGDSVFTYFKAKLADTGINVQGTFAFKGKPVLTKDGENEFTVVFTPSDTAYSVTEFTIIVHGMKYAVVSVETVIPDITDKKVGASLSALGLPGKVTVKLDSGDTTELKVTWEGYDPNTTGEQTLTGSLNVDSGEYAVYETEIKASAKVMLVSDTVTPDVPAFPDKVESYTGSAIEHKIGAFEGLESVKHEYEGIDGTVYAKTETPPVNAGKYRVTATFTMKDGYAAVSPKSATLTIKKAAQNLTAADVNAVYGDTGRKIDVKNAVGALLYTVKSGSEVVTVSSDGALTFAKAGEAYVTVTARGDENRENASVNVKITVSKKNVYITAADKTAYAGESAPSLDSPVYGKDYTVTGLVGDDRLSADVFVLLEYKDTPDMSRGGVFPREYTVIPKIFGEDARYALIAVNGTLTVRAGSGGNTYIPLPALYAVKVSESKNGTISVNRANAFEDDRVTVTVKPDRGYKLQTLTVKDRRGREIKLTEKVGEDGVYVFRMPASTVYVSASFANKILFNDVSPDAPYFDAVIWAVENGVTTGKSDTVFDPMGTCTRAEAVTFLWRSAGSPKPKTSSANMIFDDVAKGSYYYNAVLWAIENGITNGTSETTFSPERKCSRAHIITFIYRYEKAMGGGMAGEWMFLCPFDDVGANEYYFEPVMWAAASGVALTDDVTVFEVKRAGILDGSEDEGVLYLPDADCSRAMMVEYLYRYLCLTDER